MSRLSHLSLRGEPSWALTGHTAPQIHYFAYDISPWISSTAMLPPTFANDIAETFSGLRILRLVGYWVLCETPPVTAPVQLETPVPPIFDFPAQAASAHTEGLFNYIGYSLGTESSDEVGSASITSPTLYIEPGFLNMLSCLPHLQALEVGSFAVRDAGRLRTRPGNARHWLAQRARWEDEFVHRITSQAARRLVAVSFLACDEPLYGSCFNELPPRHRWGRYLRTVKKQIPQDNATLGITLSELIAQAGLASWSGCVSEPDNKCDYRSNSGFVPSNWSRQLLEEVITSEWVKAGTGGTWTRRTNVRNLRDIWPAGC
ncbi:hypothetical protein FRC07_000516 [Ceratobasidium sp. 392]|nr:hypothetical protein FRC07_000516 [Ceratobasidium sp. 392]